MNERTVCSTISQTAVTSTGCFLKKLERDSFSITVYDKSIESSRLRSPNNLHHRISLKTDTLRA